MALKPVVQWEHDHPGNFVHKGTPFYFWGMTAILRGEIDRGYLFMHRAVKEDERTDPKNYQQRPGFYFASLNYQEAQQAFQSWLLQQARFQSDHLEIYRSSYQRTLTLEDFQARFLNRPPSVEAVSLLGYVIARLMRLNHIPTFAFESSFASQIEGNLLFDLVSVVDAGI